jgi:hypothetical protein
MQDLRRISLTVRRFFVPIIGWHKPYMNEEYTPDLAVAVQQFRSTFIPAAIFGAVRDVATCLTDVNNIPFSPYAIALDSFFTGIDFSAFPLVNSLLLHQFAPKLKTRSAWFAWTAAASCVTGIAFHTIEVAAVNAYSTGKCSLKGWASDLAVAKVLMATTFSTTVQGLDRMLPPPERMGGRLPRSAAVVAMADVARTVASAPIVNPKGDGFLSGTLRRCLTGVPLTLLDFAMYSGVNDAYRRLIGQR